MLAAYWVNKPNLAIQKRIRKIEELPPAKQRIILQTIDTFIRGVETEKQLD